MTERIGTSLEMNDGKCHEIHIGDTLVDGNGSEWVVNRYRQLENENGEKIGWREWKKYATRYVVCKPWQESEAMKEERADLEKQMAKKEEIQGQEEDEHTFSAKFAPRAEYDKLCEENKRITAEVEDALAKYNKLKEEYEQLSIAYEEVTIECFSSQGLVNELRGRGYEVKCTRTIVEEL